MANATPSGGARNAQPLSARAEQYAEHAYDMLTRRHATPRPEDREDVLQASSTLARVAEALAMRDLADSNRELARASNDLALSYDALTDELRARSGVRAQVA